FCQAEDGIRDRNVTGVQTCALPISMAISPTNEPNGTPIITAIVRPPFTAAMLAVFLCGGEIAIARLIVNPKKGACIEAERSLERSEERRVGMKRQTGGRTCVEVRER